MNIIEINRQIARIMGFSLLPGNSNNDIYIRYGSHQHRKFNPCEDWADGGPLIDIYGISLNFTNSICRTTIKASDPNKPNATATAPDILPAAMLAIIEYDRLIQIK